MNSSQKKRLPFGRPSPAMVVAVMALIVALGGTSYAATKLAKNSVGAKQIRKNAVTAKKIKANAVNSSKVKNYSLLAKDFQRNSLPKGPRGATGPAGPIEGTPAGGDLSGTYPNPALAAFPAARAKASTVQSLPSSTPTGPTGETGPTGAIGDAGPTGDTGSPGDSGVTPIELDKEQFDTGDMYLAPDDVITTKKRGTYLITGQLGWQGDTNGSRQLRIMAGGSLIALDQTSPGTDGNVRQTVSGVARLSPGDAVSLVAFQNSGKTLSTVVNPGQIGGAWLAVNWVGP